MDLKGYYRKIREVENSIEEEFPVIKSLPTEAGGRGGRLVEVRRATAARMIVNAMAEFAAPEEAAKLRRQAEEARAREQERLKASQIQFTVLSGEDLRALQKSGRSRKE